jgi:phosphatidylinositol glycan class H protein
MLRSFSYFLEYSFVTSVAITVALIVIRIYLLLTKVTVEEVAVMKGFGLFAEAKTRLGRSSYVFIPKQSVNHVIINEGITFVDILFYLAVIVEGRDKMVLLFDNLRPRLPILTEIWRDVTENL